ncbi:DEAD/DEAH box helicase [Burkholderia cepacia]|uniref:DEAD/DEAH box helicase n=1 Tax=Burkholderia cepacia TaxID=292 RepID=UPI0021477158|nr:DEAD/DEAH box helicase [Burkholderia cepacia]
MQYFTRLIDQTLNRTREATLSILGISDVPLRNHLREQMGDTLGADGCFLAPPVFEHTFGWQEADDVTLGDLRGSLLSGRLLDTLQSATRPYQFASDSRPYVHQLKAWTALLGESPRSAVITSGTGSGKTECFMLPILEDLIREHQAGSGKLTGVRALFLYPLNALINSQRDRLHAWTKEFGADIRFCLYNGKTEEFADTVRKEQATRPNEILSREELRKHPAPMLMTNATMLEYMLVRQVDAPILEISRQQGSLRWIVLDEAHTYVGSQAAELALLLRRVVQAFGKKPEEIRFVATSATIADRDSDERLRQYLAGLAGVPAEQVVVVGGTRRVPDLPATAVKWRSIDDVRSIEAGRDVAPARFAALAEHPVAAALRHAIVGNGRPLDLNELEKLIGDGLLRKRTGERQREVLEWLDLMSGTRHAKDEPPFIKLRIHLFQRMLHGLWACVDAHCTAKPSTLTDWPFGSVYVTQRPKCECGAPVYELAFCDDCKTPHLLAEDSNGQLLQRSPYANDEFEVSYEGNDEDQPGPDASDSLYRPPATRLLIAATLASEEPYFPMTLDLRTLELGASTADARSFAIASDAEACCCHCAADFAATPSLLRQSYLGSPFYVANAVPTVLEFCPDPSPEDCEGKSPDELPGRGRKLITFTDSRQGTARMAVRMQQEAERSRLRGLVFEILRNAQAKIDAGPKDKPTASYEEIVATAKTLESMGYAQKAAEMLADAEKKKAGVDIRRMNEITWRDMAHELASSKDISQSILDYNKYANPELFGNADSAAPMARLLLAREYARRPKNQNSTETLALVSVGYEGLDRIASAPNTFLQRKPGPMSGTTRDTNLTLQDWKDFLKVALDFHVRENTFIRLNPSEQRWMGARFTAKQLMGPRWDGAESNTIKKWPQVRGAVASRLVKLLELGCGLDRSLADDHDIIDHLLEQAWLALIEAKILEPIDGRFALNLNTLIFSFAAQGWVCPLTHRMFDTTFVGLTPYLPRRYREGDFRCRKVQLPKFPDLAPSGDSEPALLQVRRLVSEDARIQALRAENLWTDVSDRTAEGGFYYRTAEHSAQQSSKKLEAYEELFKRGKINVLNCSTTMEMGVDIGGISAVVMNNVPPHPANYLQRAGRAGRRSEARSIAYTLCKANPHNQRVFGRPTWPFVTAIPAPGIALSSERIVQRHINSMLLGRFLRTLGDTGTDRTKLTLKWFFGGQDDSFCTRFVDWLQSQPNELASSVRELARGTVLAARSWQSLAADAATSIQPLQARWRTEHDKLTQLIQNASEAAYKKALGFELKRHDDEYLLRDLAMRAFLPGHGFPTDVVSLNTYNVEDFIEQARRKEDKTREDNVFSSKELPTRGLDIAIREYAPGAQIVIDGRVFRSAGVALHWHSGGAINEPQKFDIAWTCNCGARGFVENAYSNSDVHCTRCGEAIALSARQLVLRPSGFVTDFYESTTNDVSSQKFIRVAPPRIQLDGETLSLPDSRCGHFNFGHRGSVFYRSSGEHEHGYAVCLSCGRAESMTHDGQVPKALQPGKMHRPVGGPKGSKKEASCSNEAIKPFVHLGHHCATDVLELVLRSPKTGEWLGNSADDRVVAMTLAVAMRDAIAAEIGVASTEMGYGTRPDRDHATSKIRTVIQLFDQVSGGAGFVLSALPQMVKLLTDAASRLNCPVNCENVCSACLASNDSRVEQEELDRRKAKQWLEDHAFLAHLALPADFSAIPGAAYCSFCPDRFIRERINRGAKRLDVVLSGNSNDWDLGHSGFRDRVLSWKISDGLDVRILVPSSAVLSAASKQSLSFLAGAGVQIGRREGTEMVAGVSAIAQIGNGEVTETLFTLDQDAATPGEHWLRTHDLSVWVSSQDVSAYHAFPLDIAGWDLRDKGATVVEISTELNGPVSSLTKRLLTMFASQAPGLAGLLETDHAVDLEYSDRYLKSPWSVMVMSGFLALFRNERLKHLRIVTLEPSVPATPSSVIKHDWPNAEDMHELVEAWLTATVSVKPLVTMCKKTHDVQHSRVLTINWASGKKTKLIFDQGAGYWQPRAQYAEQLVFNFNAKTEPQALRMFEQYKFINMMNGGVWSTLFYIVEE